MSTALPAHSRWNPSPTISERATVRSLADIQPAEQARIEHVLFEMLRDQCFGLGLREGDRIRCRRNSGASIVLEAADGRTVVLDPDWARFVRIAPCD